MRIHILTVTLVIPMMLASGFFLARGSVDGLGDTDGLFDSGAAQPNQIETIFLALDRTDVDVPVERPGSGGALTSWDDALIVMTHEGGFFDVTGDEAVPLDIAAPPNGWADMLEFESDNSNYSFAHFYFRYNDLHVIDEQLYVSFTEWVAQDDCYRTTLARAPLQAGADRPTIGNDDWSIIFATAPCLAPSMTGRAIQGHMAGGRFDVGSDGMIYLASGDYALDGNYANPVISQDPATDYGKVLMIDPATGQVETLSQGHSNPQGIVVTDASDIYTVEHGRRGGDELNRIVFGSDFGWPQVSLGTRYNRLPLPNTREYGRHPDFPLPVFAWLPSVAPSALMQIDGFDSSWDGDLLAGTLASQSLVRIRIADGRVLFDERIFIGERVRYAYQFDDVIALWTDSKKVVKLTAGEFDPSAQFAVALIPDLGLGSTAERNTEVALDQCIECHSLGVVDGANAPALGAVFGREIASGNFDYSDGLAAVNGIWSRESLIAYITDPDGFAPGTSMPNPQIGDEEIVAALVDILQALAGNPE